MDMKEHIIGIKKKQERLAELLDEYRKSKENEHKQYHLFEDLQTNDKIDWLSDLNKADLNFYLVDRITQKVICYGVRSRLKSWMRLRNITKEKVLVDTNNFGGF